MNTNALPESIKSAKPALDKLHKVADDLGISMSQLALSFMRDTDGIASLVLGCETTEQLLDSTDKFSAPTLQKNTLDKLLEISEEVAPIVIRPWEWKK